MAKVGKVRPCREIQEKLQELEKGGYLRIVSRLKKEISVALENGDNLYNVKKEIDRALHYAEHQKS